jgi:hypothetical protein
MTKKPPDLNEPDGFTVTRAGLGLRAGKSDVGNALSPP